MFMDQIVITEEQLEKASNILKAIAHPVRLHIMSLLGDNNKLTVTEIHQAVNIEQASASHHLGILKDKGVLLAKKDGKNTYYYLKDNQLSTIVDCVCNCATNE
jgi:DNA-binding transcriptional ArsR family regulator